MAMTQPGTLLLWKKLKGVFLFRTRFLQAKNLPTTTSFRISYRQLQVNIYRFQISTYILESSPFSTRFFWELPHIFLPKSLLKVFPLLFGQPSLHILQEVLGLSLPTLKIKQLEEKVFSGQHSLKAQAATPPRLFLTFWF